MTSLPAPLAIKGSARNQQDVRLTSRSLIRAGHARNRPIPITGRSIGASLLLADSLASLGAKDTKEKEKTNDGLTKKSTFVPCQALCGEQFPWKLVGIYSFPKHKYTHTHSTNTNTATDGALDADYTAERDSKYLVKEYQRLESLV